MNDPQEAQYYDLIRLQVLSDTPVIDQPEFAQKAQKGPESKPVPR